MSNPEPAEVIQTIDHISLGVSDLDRGRAFYDAALKPLGVSCLYSNADVAGYGRGQHPQFWVALYVAKDKRSKKPSASFHVCFQTERRSQVDAFYKAALAAGAKDNGAPGLRPQYTPTYYGAFAIAPDGHHIEAVCTAPD